MEKDKKYYIFSLDIKICNIVSIVIFIMLFLIVNIHYNIKFISLFDRYNILFIVFIYLIWLMLHEFIHSIGYYINGCKWNNIIYGISLEKGILYCLCKENISKKNILISSLLPFIVIGIFTFIIGILFRLDLLVYLSIINISGSICDIITFMFIFRLKSNIKFTEMDNEIYFCIYSNYDVSKTSHFGLKYIGCKSEIERKDLCKIRISSFSIIVLIGLLVFSILLGNM